MPFAFAAAQEATYSVCGVTSENRPDEGTPGAERGDHFFLRAGHWTIVQVVLEHHQHPGNNTRVVTKQHAGNGGG